MAQFGDLGSRNSIAENEAASPTANATANATAGSLSSPDVLPIMRSGLFRPPPEPVELKDAGSGTGTSEKKLFNATEGQHFYGVVKPLIRASSIRYLQTMTENDDLTPQAKMRRLVDAIEDALGCYKWIRSRHLALLLACVRELPHGMCEKTKYFGNYRVDIVVMLFGHIVDRHNFQLVLRELTPFESACVSMRIGMLNYFNPMSPEGSQSLDLSSWEQRQVAKAYTMLVIHEPGENWAVRQFRWTIDSPNIPGWVLTAGWVEDATMPTRGILELTYYCGEGERKNKCVPLIDFRKSLLHMTTLDEAQFVEEDAGSGAVSFRRDLVDEFINNLPVMGRLQFDFSGEAPPEDHAGVHFSVTKDVAIIKILMDLHLIQSWDLQRRATCATAASRATGTRCSRPRWRTRRRRATAALSSSRTWACARRCSRPRLAWRTLPPRWTRPHPRQNTARSAMALLTAPLRCANRGVWPSSAPWTAQTPMRPPGVASSGARARWPSSAT